MLRPSLIIFSGLPGTGKSTLSTRLAGHLRLPILRIDDIALQIPPGARTDFWDTQIAILLRLAESQLELGVSVILDSVFMAYDRHHAQQIARAQNATFRPIYTFVSDDALWQQRVTQRYQELNDEVVATWERIQHQRQSFLPWEQDTALFVDSVQPLEENFASVLAFATQPDPSLKPLTVPSNLVPGKYHL